MLTLSPPLAHVVKALKQLRLSYMPVVLLATRDFIPVAGTHGNDSGPVISSSRQLLYPFLVPSITSVEPNEHNAIVLESVSEDIKPPRPQITTRSQQHLPLTFHIALLPWDAIQISGALSLAHAERIHSDEEGSEMVRAVVRGPAGLVIGKFAMSINSEDVAFRTIQGEDG